MRAVLSSTRGTRSRPLSVFTMTATSPSMKPISTCGHIAEPEDHDEQRIEREDRDRVVGGEQRIERLAQRAPAVDQRAEDDADDDGGDAGDGDVGSVS